MDKDLETLEFDDSLLVTEETVYDEVESYFEDDLVDLAQCAGW